MVDINAFLPTVGIELTGWTLVGVSISPDGRSLAGWGNHNGTPEAWVATVPPFCHTAITPPQDATVNAGEPAAFTVVSADPTHSTYRWMRNGVNLSNSTRIHGVLTPTLTIGTVELNDAGVYACRVTVSGCARNSAGATLTVVCPPDFNNDGFLDFFDLDAFVAAFESGDPAADFNEDGFLDFFDADAFVLAFENGC